MESLLILVWHMRQEAHYCAVKAMVQGLISEDAKALESVWKEFSDKFFPYSKPDRIRNDLKALEYLNKEVNRGPLVVTPQIPLLKSRISSKKVSHAAIKKRPDR
jgi:hypothetical protein